MENDEEKTSRPGKGETLFWQKQWALLIENAMLFYGTSFFFGEVLRVKDALVDIKADAKIKTEVETYYDTIWIPLCWSKFKQLATPNTMIHWQNIYWKRIQNEYAILLLNHIRQTIQKNGYGLRLGGGYEIGKEE